MQQLSFHGQNIILPLALDMDQCPLSAAKQKVLNAGKGQKFIGSVFAAHDVAIFAYRSEVAKESLFNERFLRLIKNHNRVCPIFFTRIFISSRLKLLPVEHSYYLHGLHNHRNCAAGWLRIFYLLLLVQKAYEQGRCPIRCRV